MKSSLRTKIAAIVVLVLTAGGGITTYLFFNNSSTALKNTISKNLSNDTNQALDKVDRFLYERLVDVQQISGREQIQRFVADPKTRSVEFSTTLTKQLSDFKVLVGTWSDITVTDTSGKVILTTDDTKSANELSQQNEFKSVFKTAASGQSSYSDVILETSNGKPVMLFMSPIRQSSAIGQPIIGVLAGELEWSSALEIFNGFKDVTGTLINSHGTFLGDNQLNTQDSILSKDLSKSSAFLASKSSLTGGTVLSGLSSPKTSFLTAYSKEAGFLDYKGNGWTAVFQTPESRAFEPAKVLARKLIITFVIMLLISVLAFIITLNRQVVRPILSLKDAFGRIAAGDFSEPVRIASHDEIGQLASGFNAMSNSLQTASRKLQEEHSRLESSINSLDIGLLMTFASSDLLYYNPAVLNILDIDPDVAKLKAATALTLEVLYQIISGLDLQGAIDKAQHQGISFVGGQVTYNDKILSFSGAPIISNDKVILGAVVTIEDITESKVMERSKDEFFSIASHELRTPLTSIKGNAAMIMDYYSEQLKDPSLKEMIGDIKLSSERLIEIVNDFLDLSRLEQGKIMFKPEEFSLEEVVESVVYEMKAVLAQKNLHLTFDRMTLDSMPKVWADKNRVKQIVYNLVGNASKFTEKGGISINAAHEGDHIKVLITDTGRGIPEDGQKLLFRKFQQASNSILTRDTTRGTGLGLYISKMLIENMGGKINLENSELDKGSTFSFTLPTATNELKSKQAKQNTNETNTVSGLSTKAAK